MLFFDTSSVGCPFSIGSSSGKKIEKELIVTEEKMMEGGNLLIGEDNIGKDTISTEIQTKHMSSDANPNASCPPSIGGLRGKKMEKGEDAISIEGQTKCVSSDADASAGHPNDCPISAFCSHFLDLLT